MLYATSAQSRATKVILSRVQRWCLRLRLNRFSYCRRAKTSLLLIKFAPKPRPQFWPLGIATRWQVIDQA